MNVRDDVINLTFHGVGEPTRPLDPGEQDVWSSRADFESVLDAVVGRKDVRLSFDDGNLSDVRIALPELAKRGLRAEFFVVAGRTGQPHFLGEADLRALIDAGMSIGSHGMRHRPWGQLGAEELRAEVFEAKSRLEALLERPVVHAACPFGDYRRRVLVVLREAGFDRVFTSDRGRAWPGQWLQPRNSVTAGDDAASIARLIDEYGSEPRAVRGLRLMAKAWR